MATKKDVARLLGITRGEVMRRVACGELKAHKKTGSKFSDWDIEMPREVEAGKVEAKVRVELKGAKARAMPPQSPEAEVDAPDEQTSAETSQSPEEVVEEVREQQVIEEKVEVEKPPVRNVNPAVKGASDGTRALERRRLFLLRRREQNMRKEKTSDDTRKQGSGRREETVTRDGGGHKEGDRSNTTKAQEEPKWFWSW